MIRIGALAFFLGAVSTLTFSQILLNPPRDPAIIRVDVELVNVLFTVRDRNGGYVKGLRKEDFEIQENGRAQEIRHFAKDLDTPITVALLIDTSGSVSNVLAIEQEAARKFFKDVLRPTDKALLVSFASHIAVWQDFTSSIELLDGALSKTGEDFQPIRTGEMRYRGGTLLFDSVGLVARDKLVKQQGRKAMVILTDGLDSGSISSLEAASQEALKSDTVIFGIHYEAELLPDKKAPGFEVLRKLTEPTGGRAFQVDRKNTLDKIFAAIQEEMRNQYAIGFKPADEPRDGSFRKLAVKAKKSGMKITTRNGYFAVRK